MLDILPSDQPYWQSMRSVAANLAKRYGYSLIETPVLEPTALFERTAGDTSDIVMKEMYTFRDRSDRLVTLRAEWTAPVVRAYFEGGLDQEPQPVRLYYIGPVFRYGRPQAGRFRQHTQFGVEVIGEGSPWIDVEVIELGWRWFELLKIMGVNLQLNSIGDEVCRPAYRELLRAYYRPYLASLCDDDQIRFERNPLRMLDCKVPGCQPFKKGAPRILDHLCEPCRTAFQAVRDGLRRIGVPHTINVELVRGLDYYTRTVFEFWHESLGGAQNALGAGGRYDGLAAELGFKSTPGVGFGLGMERTAEILKQQNPQETRGPDVYAVAVEPSAHPHVLRLAADLRARGFQVVVDHGDARLETKLRKAARREARAVVMVGPEEDSDGRAVVRDMRNQTQVTVADRDVPEEVRRAFAADSAPGPVIKE